MEETNMKETKICIADKNTGSIYGGIWPEDLEYAKLQSVQIETKNFNYRIMTVEEANIIKEQVI